MSALEAEVGLDVIIARVRKLPGAAVGKLERRAWIGAGTSADIPLVGDRDLLGESYRHGPAAQWGGAGIEDTHVYLEGGSVGIGRRGSTAVRGECLIAQQQAGQQYPQFE
jgi:hypothetical protein